MNPEDLVMRIQFKIIKWIICITWVVRYSNYLRDEKKLGEWKKYISVDTDNGLNRTVNIFLRIYKITTIITQQLH